MFGDYKILVFFCFLVEMVRYVVFIEIVGGGFLKKVLEGDLLRFFIS